jgi:DNA-binding HxlR family transcriptional regulator
MTTSCVECRSPVEHALHAIGGKWKPMILWQLLEGTRRFAEIQRAIPEVSAKVLTEQLRELEADGLLGRAVFAEVPPRVEYTLTALGRGLESVLAALCDWGRDYEARGPGAGSTG